MRLTTPALALTTALVVLSAPAAHALPPTTITVDDAQDPGAAYDIAKVTVRAAPRTNRPAVVVVKHSRRVSFGDNIDVWVDLDDDKRPDVHVSGSSFSEYAVHLTSSFTRDGKDITDDDCARLEMSGRTSKVRLFPECLGQPVSLRVSVRSATDEDDGADDWAPGRQRFSTKVLAAPLS